MANDKCPRCGVAMRRVTSVGLSGTVYLTCPPQQDVTYACDSCQVKKIVREFVPPTLAPAYDPANWYETVNTRDDG